MFIGGAIGWAKVNTSPSQGRSSAARRSANMTRIASTSIENMAKSTVNLRSMTLTPCRELVNRFLRLTPCKRRYSFKAR